MDFCFEAGTRRRVDAENWMCVEWGTRRRAGRYLRTILAAMVVTVGMMSISVARAATITVGTLEDRSGIDGCSLRDAITTANGGVVGGSGCPSPTADPSNTINFSVVGTIALNSTLPKIDGTLLITASPGSGGRIKIDGVKHYQVMIVNSGAVVRLRNLEIENGAISLANIGNAAGIENDGTLTVTDSALYRNDVGFLGNRAGGIYNDAHATLTVINSALVENRGFLNGGGGILNKGTLRVSRSGFNKNESSSGGASGIMNRGGSATISDTSFIGNIGTGGVGGIRNLGDMAIVNSLFYRNNAFAAGGIENDGTLTITNSTFAENSTQRGATDRFHSGGGGGILNSGTLTITNSTFSRNRMATGLEPDIGGGILNAAGSLRLKGTILAGAPSTPNCAGKPITDEGYNLVDDNSCMLKAVGSKNNTDAQLDPAGLARNGGPTDTIALQASSPALDQIPPASCTYPAGSLNPCSDSLFNQLTCDQRGLQRPGDPTSSLCDIGAYERQSGPVHGRSTGPSAID